MIPMLLLAVLPSGTGCDPVQITQGLVTVTSCVGDTHTFSVTATGSNLSYQWTRGNGTVVPGDSSTLVVPDIDMEDRGLWCVTVSNECSSATSCARISVQQCQTELCTLTQGAWGNPGGQFQGQNRFQLLTSLLSSGPITLGISGVRSVQIANAQCVLDRLPAGGTPAALPNFGDQVLNTSSCQTVVPLPLNNQGNFRNILLGQTLALSLNLRLSPNLVSTPLCPQMTTDNGPIQIPLSVLSAMMIYGHGHTADGLLAFANQALAGQPTGIATLSDINAAVDAVNRGFDECATLLGCY
jgi:hypothetical protein